MNSLTSYTKIVLTIFLLFAIIFDCNSQRFPSASMPAPQEWNGAVFQLSQDYPAIIKKDDKMPWLEIDYKKDPKNYLMTVYRYVIEGNVEANWVLQNNQTRKWYHAPWMHYRFVGDMDMGREPINGLTRERDSRPYELSDQQSTIYQNWAIGFYNPLGGYTVGQVWKDENNPDPTKAVFADGAVSAKIIFTEADSIEVPYLKGAPEFTCLIYKKAGDPTVRKLKKLHLLQVDIAVKDPRAKEGSGWVMGTFFYQGNIENVNPWLRVLPVGLAWGNDPGITTENVKSNPLKDCFVNPEALKISKLGWAGRVNGLIDNPQSSCISCHGSAASPMLGGGAPDDGMTKAERMHWFSKTASLNNSYFDNTTSLDYSLQLAFGIQNFKDWKATHIARSFPTKIADRLTAWTYPDTFITTILIFLVLGFIIYKKPSWLVSDESLNNGRAILFIRIFIGIIMFYHGMPKILGGENTWMKLGLTMSNFGIYWRPLAWGYMASMTEALGGLLIVVGLAFRPAAFMLAVNLLVAAAKHIFAGQGLDTASHPLALAAIFIFLLVVGPGKKSLDFIIVNKKLNPTLS
jgi:uncharacterized membrane protein YphA (DoxX/SURF4 family)